MQEDAAIEQLSAYLDGELTDTEVAELEVRLARDPALRAELDSMRFAVDLLRTHGPVQAPPALYGDILRAVEDEPMPGGFWVWLQRPFGLPLPTLALAGAAVAVVAVTVGGTVVATTPGVLRPAVADYDWSSVSDAKKEGGKDQTVAAKVADPEPTKPAMPTPAAERSQDMGSADELRQDAEGPESSADAGYDAKEKMALGIADDGETGAASTDKKAMKELVEGVDSSSYASKGKMYSGGPVVSIGLKPEDLERVAALYQKFAGTQDARANKVAARLANLPAGTNTITLDLPDDQARNAFEQELQRAFQGTFHSKPASEDGFTLDHARMKLSITVADQFPGTSGGELEQPPIQTMRKGKDYYDEVQEAPAQAEPARK